jgi:hypothetical protein
MKLTTIEQLILRAAQSRPNTWLNCDGRYIGEVLALQCKGLIVSRRDSNQM